MPSRGHLFYSARVTFSSEMEVFVKGQSCRRQSLLASIGGVVDGLDDRVGCCDVCSPQPASSRLNILDSIAPKRKKRRVKRAVDVNLEKKLKDIRGSVFKEHPEYRMLGIEFLCPNSTIKKVCEEAEYARAPGDFSVYLRLELKDKFFSAALASP